MTLILRIVIVIKITGKLDLQIKDIENYVSNKLSTATNKIVEKTANTIRNHASNNLRSGLSKWSDGFKVEQINKDTYVLSINGKLAMMMEDKISVGEIGDMISKGNRARYNKSKGKNYVDVPIPKDTTNIQVFNSADDMLQQFKKKTITVSDIKSSGVKKEEVLSRRVNSIIETHKNKESNSQFLIIRRYSLDNKTKWPKKEVKGVKALDKGAEEIERIVDSVLRSVF